MKEVIMVCIFCCVQFFASSQLQGDIARDNRQLLTETNFIMEGNQNGKMVFNIAVESTGKVSSVSYDADESTIISTPTKIKVRNYINDFKFEPGTHYPKFHQGRIIITIVAPKE